MNKTQGNRALLISAVILMALALAVPASADPPKPPPPTAHGDPQCPNVIKKGRHKRCPVPPKQHRHQ